MYLLPPQASPLFSQERAPTSVAYAENQVRLQLWQADCNKMVLVIYHLVTLFTRFVIICGTFELDRTLTSQSCHVQSMFLDAFGGDAAWLGRYAYSREGAVIPWDIIEKNIRDTHPYEVGFCVQKRALVCAERSVIMVDDGCFGWVSVKSNGYHATSHLLSLQLINVDTRAINPNVGGHA